MALLSLRTLYLSAVFLAVAAAQNAALLRKELAAAGVTAVYPDDAAYANASRACTHHNPLAVTYVDGLLDNTRYVYAPAVITYPTTPKQVSAVVKAGASQNLRVAARSGGVSFLAKSTLHSSPILAS